MQSPGSYEAPIEAPAASVEPTPFVTVAEAAARLGISASNAYRLIRKGQFPVEVIRIGSLKRIRRAQLERYLVGEAG